MCWCNFIIIASFILSIVKAKNSESVNPRLKKVYSYVNNGLLRRSPQHESLRDTDGSVIAHHLISNSQTHAYNPNFGNKHVSYGLGFNGGQQPGMPAGHIFDGSYTTSNPNLYVTHLPVPNPSKMKFSGQGLQAADQGSYDPLVQQGWNIMNNNQGAVSGGFNHALNGNLIEQGLNTNQNILSKDFNLAKQLPGGPIQSQEDENNQHSQISNNNQQQVSFNNLLGKSKTLAEDPNNSEPIRKLNYGTKDSFTCNPLPDEALNLVEITNHVFKTNHLVLNQRWPFLRYLQTSHSINPIKWAKVNQYNRPSLHSLVLLKKSNLGEPDLPKVAIVEKMIDNQLCIAYYHSNQQMIVQKIISIDEVNTFIV